MAGIPALTRRFALAPAKKRRAGIYVRISQDRNASNAGVEAQEEECRTLAESLGWTVIGDVYSDNDTSAYSGKRRPAYERLWADVEAGVIDAVLAYHPKRLYRRMVALEELVSLAEKNGNTPIKTVAGGEVDLSTAAGRAIARIMAALAQMESEESGERISLSKRRTIAKGIWTGGGRRTYGYTGVKRGEDGKAQGLAIVEDEATVILEIRDRVLAGDSVNRIVMDLNERGVPTSSGGRWRPTTLRRIFGADPEATDRKRTLPIVAGGKNWPAILTKDELAVVKAKLQTPSKFAAKVPTTGRRYAFTGILECSECGTKLLGSGGYYRCQPRNGGCGKVGVKARQLEDVLDRLVQARREAGLAVDAVTPAPIDQAQRAELLAEAGEYQADVDRLSTDLVTARTDTARRAIMSALDDLDARVREVDSRLAALVPESAATPSYADLLADDDWRERWITGELTGTEIAELHDLFASYFDAVQVAPRTKRTPTLDPRRIKVRWR